MKEGDECEDGWEPAPSPSGAPTSTEYCDECDAGKYGNDGTCYTCTEGKYQDEQGQTSCKMCDAGYEQGVSCKTICLLGADRLLVPQSRKDKASRSQNLCALCEAGKHKFTSSRFT